MTSLPLTHVDGLSQDTPLDLDDDIVLAPEIWGDEDAGTYSLNPNHSGRTTTFKRSISAVQIILPANGLDGYVRPFRRPMACPAEITLAFAAGAAGESNPPLNYAIALGGVVTVECENPTGGNTAYWYIGGDVEPA